MLFSIDKIFNWKFKSHVGSQLGIFYILILFKQLLSDKIFLEQDKN